jgi:hypothetical protein
MAEILTRVDFYNIGRRYLLAKAKKIDPDQVDVEGSDANLFVGSTSFMAQAIARLLVDRVSALLLDGAEGEDLDRYAFDKYQLLRKGAGPALGEVTLTRNTFTAGAGNIPTGTKLRSLTGIEYVTTTTAVFGGTDLTAPASVRSVQAGTAFQVGKNQIRAFDDASQIFDASITPNNADPTAGGADAELDGPFKERIRSFWLAARRGTLSAIEFGALTVVGVDSAQAVEALSPDTVTPARAVILYIADAAGVASKALAAATRVALNEYRAAGISVSISTSVPELIEIVLSLKFTSGVDTNALAEAVRAAVIEFVNSLQVNQQFLRSDLSAVLARFREDGLKVDDQTVVTPAGDITPTPGHTIRTRPELVKAA